MIPRILFRWVRFLVPSGARAEWIEEWSTEIAEADSHDRGSGNSIAWAAVGDAFTQFQYLRLETLIRDIRYSVRSILRAPLSSAVVVVTLALGIGANAATYSIVDRVLLRPLNVSNPAQLVRVWGESSTTGERLLSSSYADVHDYREMTNSFSGFGTYTTGMSILNGDDLEPTRIPVLFAGEGLFEVLGVEAQRGRTFVADEHIDGRTTVALLSAPFHSSFFGGEQDVIGTTISLGGMEREIVGVLPDDFTFGGADIAAYVPAVREIIGEATNESADGFGRDWRQLGVVARMANGVTQESAESDLRRVAALLESEHPATNTGHSVWLQPYHETLVAGVDDTLIILLAAVSAVLLVACLNIASIQVARTAGRQRELAVRTAIGASRRNLVAQLVTESLVLAVAGGAVGMLLGNWILEYLLANAPFGIPRASEIAMDTRIFLILGAITCGSRVVVRRHPGS